MFTRTSSIRTAAAAIVGGIALTLGGCHGPGGALIGYTGASQTYASTTWSPKTVRVLDLRTNETVFEVDVPVGQQLTIDFIEEGGDDPVYTPSRMRYQIWEVGTRTGKLQNSLTVPSAKDRLVVVDVRQGPEYADGENAATLGRVDDAEDRPGWWSPRGGQIPARESGQGNYEG